jgi:hypothetical protein
MRIIIALAAILLLVSCKRNEKYIGCWIESDESGTEGHCRHNGILTDSGYLFTDTIYSHELNKMVVHTTLFSIIKQ